MATEIKSLEQALAEITALETSLASITAERDAATASLAATALELSTVKTDLAAVTTDRDEAEDRLETVETALAGVTVERDALKASQADFDKRVAVEVAKHGIAHKAPAGEAATENPPKLNATQQCLAAKGLPVDSKITISF